MPVSTPFLRLRNVRGKAHAGSCPVRNLSLELERGERLALLGGAGAGKSSVLALLAGFARIEAGEIAMDGNSLAGTPAHRRGIAVVQGEADLLPDISVAENLGFVASLRGADRTASRGRVERALAAVGRPELGERPAHLLEPAERLPVALARAFVSEPKLLLLDEPFASLDTAERRQLAQDVRALLGGLALTTILATRHPGDAFALAGRIAVLRGGLVIQLGTPQALYETPVSAYVARSTGEANCLPGLVESIDDELASVRLECGPMVLAAPAEGCVEGGHCRVVIRPERIAVAAVAAEEMGNGALPVLIHETAYRGDHVRIGARIGGAAITIIRPAAAGLLGLAPGEPAAIAWQPAHAHVFPPDPLDEMNRPKPREPPIFAPPRALRKPNSRG